MATSDPPPRFCPHLLPGGPTTRQSVPRSVRAAVSDLHTPWASGWVATDLSLLCVLPHWQLGRCSTETALGDRQSTCPVTMCRTLGSHEQKLLQCPLDKGIVFPGLRGAGSPWPLCSQGTPASSGGWGSGTQQSDKRPREPVSIRRRGRDMSDVARGGGLGPATLPRAHAHHSTEGRHLFPDGLGLGTWARD